MKNSLIKDNLATEARIIKIKAQLLALKAQALWLKLQYNKLETKILKAILKPTQTKTININATQASCHNRVRAKTHTTPKPICRNPAGEPKVKTKNRHLQLETLETRELLSVTNLVWCPQVTNLTYGQKLGPAQLNAIVNSSGEHNPPIATLTYTDQAGNSVSTGTILPAGKDTIYASYGQYANASFTFNVTPGNLTITANNATKVYGAWSSPQYASPVTSFTYTATGFVNGDTTSSLTTKPSFTTSSQNVGSQVLTPFGAVDPNYTISYNSGVLTITPAQLTISVNDGANSGQVVPAFFKKFGQVNPTFTYTVTGLVNGDSLNAITVQPTLTTTATLNSPVNNPYIPAYPVVASGAIAPNYNINYVSGWLIVQPGPATLVVTTTPITPLPAPSPVAVPKVTKAPVKKAPVKVTKVPVKHVPVKVVHVSYKPVSHKPVARKAR